MIERQLLSELEPVEFTTQYPTGMGPDIPVNFKELQKDKDAKPSEILFHRTGFLIYKLKIYPELKNNRDLGILGNANRAFLNRTLLGLIFRAVAIEYPNLFRESLRIAQLEPTGIEKPPLEVLGHDEGPVVISKLYDALAPWAADLLARRPSTHPSTGRQIEVADLCRAL